MSSLTIRNLDEDVKARLKVRAATHGRSMEEEVRVILRQAVGGASGKEIFELSRRLFSTNGVDLELPDRNDDRASPRFDGFHEE